MTETVDVFKAPPVQDIQALIIIQDIQTMTETATVNEWALLMDGFLFRIAIEALR